MHVGRVTALVLAGLTLVPSPTSAQGTATAASAQPRPGQGTDDDTIQAGEASADEPARQLIRWNHYRGPGFTLRLGGGLLYDVAGYSQDDAAKEQFDLSPANKVRDARLTLKGSFPKLKRQVTFSAGFMYDGSTDEWLIRETGVMFAVPELFGHLFIGRTKEGFSLNKVMVGYSGWTLERSTMNDASIPILADGIKWLGYTPNHRWLWNVGFYGDWLSKDQSFSTYRRQVVARLAFLPVRSAQSGSLHVGGNFRYGKPEDGQLRFRSRPEAYPAAYFVDTGSLDAASTRMLGYEVYYRNRAWLFGSEYWFTRVNSRADDEPAQIGDDPIMHGGDVVVSWLATGETRGYNTVGGFFKSVSPARPVVQGGPGAWEIVFRASRIDLDDGPTPGGRFWRITPMVNWHLTDNARLALVYGYGRLHRFDLKGNTHFFQSRLQLLL